jgi:hypothetical protein
LKNIMKDDKAKKAEAEAVAAEVEGLRSAVEHAVSVRRRAEERLAEVKEAYASKAAAQARAIDATRREAAEVSEEMKAAVDARRLADAQKMALERQQEAAQAAHSAEVGDMIGAMKKFSAAMAGYNNALLHNLGHVEAVDIAPRRGGDGM